MQHELTQDTQATVLLCGELGQHTFDGPLRRVPPRCETYMRAALTLILCDTPAKRCRLERARSTNAH